MKRIAVSLVFLLLTGSTFAAQTTDSKPAKKGNSNASAKKPAVDCSSMTDEQITAAVKERLATTPSLKDSTINAATSGGVVTLTGKVKTGQLKGVATNQAKRVACVQKVDNKCETESKAPPTAKNKDAK
ncbi:MAG TPA: BON domain-containing protein [Blastocatellia bacterium]|nr:BON domain-containing protein [Blastocatellia bacterium]